MHTKMAASHSLNTIHLPLLIILLFSSIHVSSLPSFDVSEIGKIGKHGSNIDEDDEIQESNPLNSELTHVYEEIKRKLPPHGPTPCHCSSTPRPRHGWQGRRRPPSGPRQRQGRQRPPSGPRHRRRRPPSSGQRHK